MGSFNMNCPVTDLPINCGDSVKWTILIKHKQKSTFVLYPFEEYGFLTPLLNGKYDDCNSLIGIGPKDIFNWISKQIKPLFKASLRTVISSIEDYEYPYDFYNWTKKGVEPRKSPISLWFCHKWAFDYIRDLYPISEQASQDVDCYISQRKGIVNGEFDRESFIKSYMFENLDEETMHRRIRAIGSERVRVPQGPLIYSSLYFLKDIKNNDFDKVKDDYANALTETVRFANNLQYLRKVIRPNNTIGDSQWEEYKQIPDWLDKLKEQCEIAKKKMQESLV